MGAKFLLILVPDKSQGRARQAGQEQVLGAAHDVRQVLQDLRIGFDVAIDRCTRWFWQWRIESLADRARRGLGSRLARQPTPAGAWACTIRMTEVRLPRMRLAGTSRASHLESTAEVRYGNRFPAGWMRVNMVGRSQGPRPAR